MLENEVVSFVFDDEVKTNELQSARDEIIMNGFILNRMFLICGFYNVPSFFSF